MNSEQMRFAIRALKMTQEEFAQAMGVNLRTVVRWVSGRVEIPKTAVLATNYLLAENGVRQTEGV